MAKVGLWLRGAKGKLAGSVLQKGEKGTIARENVKPKNPQTNAQMYVRVALATAGVAARHLRPLIKETLGNDNPTRGMRQFIKLNAHILSNLYKEQYGPNVTTAQTDRSAANSKDLRMLVANPYIISKGPLRTTPFFAIKQIYNSGTNSWSWDYVAGQNSAVYGHNESVKTWKIVNDLFGAKPGDQITVAIIVQSFGTEYTINGNDQDPYHPTIFKAFRLVFKQASEYNGSMVVHGSATPAMLKDSIRNTIDMRKSAPELVAMFEEDNWNITIIHDGQGAVGTATVEVTPHYDFNNLIDTNTQSVVAVGTMLSRIEKGSWKYSNCQMCSSFSPINNAQGKHYYGYKFPVAMPTYMKNSNADSDLFTQTGGDENEV